MKIKMFLTAYTVGGIIWWFWSNNQGYKASATSIFLWPWTAYTQYRDKNAVAK